MSKDMGREDLLQELAYLYQAEYINKQAYAQLVKILEEHFAQSYHPSAFGNNKSPKPHTPQAEQKIRNRPEEYITRDDIAMYGSVENAQIAKAEQSPEPGVDVELLEIQSNMRLWALSQCNHAYKMLDKAEELTCNDCLMQIVDEIIKQLLTHLSTSGNNMSDKRTVTRKDVVELARKMNFVSSNFNQHIILITAWFQELGIEVVEK